MAVIGLRSSIWSNRSKTLFLLVLFPTLLFGSVFAAEFGLSYFSPRTLAGNGTFDLGAISDTALSQTLSVFAYL